MSLLRSGFVFAVILSAANVARSQDGVTFPTETEVKLLLTQADRAMKSYKPLIDEEEIRLGKPGADAVAKDRKVVQAVETAIAVLQKRPDGFNSPAGFALFEWLDDASRNALLCSSTSLLQSTALMAAGDISKATQLMHLAQSCMDIGNFIYTISENAGALYEKYVKAEQQLAEKGFNVSQQCADALKKMAAGNKH